MKKINITKPKILLGIPIAIISLEVYLGVVLGYFLGEFFSGKQVNQPGIIKSIIFNIGRRRIHLHHWLIVLGVLISAIWHQFLPFPQFSFGFLGGLVFQGISSYPDWHKILTKHT